MAESPAVLESYLTLNRILSKSDFSPQERELAILAVSVENQCRYCTVVHSTTLTNRLNTNEKIINNVLHDTDLEDSKLNALVVYARKSVRNRGHLSEDDINGFIDAGYSKRNVLEINLIIALITISNYTNHLADTPLDEEFQPEKVEW